jgi:hypothetical protein
VDRPFQYYPSQQQLRDASLVAPQNKVRINKITGQVR